MIQIYYRLFEFLAVFLLFFRTHFLFLLLFLALSFIISIFLLLVYFFNIHPECHSVDTDTLKGASGMIRVVNGKLCMFVNNSQSVQRQRFTVLHELGHFKLGHLGNAPMLRNYESIRTEEEQLADKFAADVLMPACVLWALNIHTAEEIVDLCNVSMQAANIRAERMKVLYGRNKFLSHPLERKVYSQFQTFINKVKKPK